MNSASKFIQIFLDMRFARERLGRNTHSGGGGITRRHCLRTVLLSEQSVGQSGRLAAQSHEQVTSHPQHGS